MVTAKKCWDVLSKKTEQALSEQQKALQVVKARYAQLLKDQDNLVNMMGQYQAQAQDKFKSLRSVSDVANFNAFLNQLHRLLSRVQVDLQAEEINVQRAKARLEQAHHAHLKMTNLQAQDRKKVQDWHHHLEQQEMDKLGLTLHHLKR